MTSPRLIKMPPLPTKPEGVNPFTWIVQVAPKIRAERQAVLELAKIRNRG